MDCESRSFMEYTLLHVEAIKQLERSLGVKHLQISEYHDLDKILFYYVLPKEDASLLHNSIQKHHNPDCSEHIVLVEKALDWESAHLTKPDKPLSAYETLLKYKKNEISVMEPVLKELNLWGETNCECISLEGFYEMLADISVSEIAKTLWRSLDYVKAISTVI